MRTAKLRRATFLVAILALVATPVLAAFGDLDYVAFGRYAGANRYGTAAAVANDFPGVESVYVATGQGFPDALAAGPAAVSRGAPVLLVTRNTIPGETAAQLSRLSPLTIYLAGGESVVSSGVAAQLEGYARSGVVIRLSGPDRYATAAEVSADAFAPGVDTAYIATGRNFPDALAGVPATGARPGPILLVQTKVVPAATEAELARLNPQRIVILGGTAVVSDAVEEHLQTLTDGPVLRLAGADRYSTAVEVSKANFTSADVVYLATGRNYPDALAGGPAAGRDGSPLLLINGGVVPAVVQQELSRLNPTRVLILGGAAAIPDSAIPAVELAMGFRTFGAGTVVVGSDIPAATYRSPGGSSCYWERLAGFSGELSDINANSFGGVNEVVTIDPADAGFNSSNCGTWYSNLLPITSNQTAPFVDGTFIVGHDIASGTWQAPGGSSCYWERLSGFSGELKHIVANSFGSSTPIVSIAAGDAGFRTSDCGTWTRMSG